MVNILLYLAEQCSHYYPVSEVEEMLSTFLPLLTKEASYSIILTLHVLTI
jgi:proteasome activator subunit 4